MRWQIGRRSGNIEDRRRLGGRGVAIGGGGGVLALALIVFLLGGDPTQILIQGAQQQQVREYTPTAEDEEQMDFLSSVLGSTEDVWQSLLEGYQAPTLVVFSGMTESACGLGQSVMGPFYCPLDGKLYLDLSFFDELQTRLNSPGDFARAYVVAHEVGHHVQNLTGGMSQRSRSNEHSVQIELQADCYAGVWAHHADAKYGLIEKGDIDEALNAATQIGDDRLAEQRGGPIMPDSFTHGSSQQRHDWFKKGYESGTPDACDTFKGGV